MAIINAKVDDNLVKEFRHVIYEKYGLRKGDFKNALEEAILDYIRKYAAEKAASSGQKEGAAPAAQQQ
ncbi:hypothetical protein Ngar_c08060 [Candidatus Nitrososphaera gargensis Ga9.2]|uniref:XACb0070 ribbon-helix-helix domain-containing protein n=1 Tax=Nitrososphaera gargensis (strain Ga9.2) TaxID=1237085 RepID=K0IG14_NITGG|nr:hypothetical protein [Candidatus Nitrososphaera gargensis]AFU57748.1 hypothetical protein Ngar_c08060 [Candidatus Nitrososphaera gargensis Ga9.2]